MSSAAPNMNTKTFGFGFRALKKFPEILPLAIIMSIASIGAASFAAYALGTKSDVNVKKSHGTPRWEHINPTQNQKILHFNQKYEEIPELEALRKEIGSYKSK